MDTESTRHPDEAAGKPEPGDHITNGVHLATWASPSFAALFDRHVPGWREDNASLRAALHIPKEEVWQAHQAAKTRAIEEVNRRANANFDLETFTIGFARRAATYRRAELLLTDPARLREIASRARRLQIIYGGKAHPRDDEGKKVIQQIIQALYQKLGQVVLPAFYQQRDDWLRVMRHAIALNASHFNTQRMVQEYIVKAYF